MHSRHLQRIEEDTTNLRLIDTEVATIDGIERKLQTIEDALADLSKQTKETEIQVTLEGNLWDELEDKMMIMRNIIGETAFKLELSLARGHIDIKRLQTSTKHIKVEQL